MCLGVGGAEGRCPTSHPKVEAFCSCLRERSRFLGTPSPPLASTPRLPHPAGLQNPRLTDPPTPRGRFPGAAE